MEVYKRDDGKSPYWQVDFVHPITKERIRQSLKVKGTKADAQKVAQKLLGDLEARGGRHEMNLEQALEAYCEGLESAGKASAAGQRALKDKVLGRMSLRQQAALAVARGGLGEDITHLSSEDLVARWRAPPRSTPVAPEAPGSMVGSAPSLKSRPKGLQAPATPRFSLPPSTLLRTLTPRVLQELVQARRSEGNGAQTIAHELKLLRAATRYAAAMGAEVNLDMINGVIRDAWRLPKLPTKTRFLTVEEFRTVFEYMRPDRPVSTRPVEPGSRLYRQRQDARDLLVALVMCGGRWSEVSGLQWSRIDLASGVIRLWGNKTTTERLVGIPAMMLEMLRRRHETRHATLVFPTTGGTQRAGSCRAISRAIEACGLNTAAAVAENGRATVHSLRHTYASLLLQNGATLADIQDALGHTSMAMTRRYAHLCKGESAAKLAGIMSSVLG